MRNPAGQEAETSCANAVEAGTESGDARRQLKAEDRLRSHQDLALRLAGASTLAETLHLSLQALLDVSGMSHGAAYLLDPITRCMKLACVEGAEICFLDLIQNEPANERLWSVLTSNCAVYEPGDDVPLCSDPKFHLVSSMAFPALHRGQAIASFVCAAAVKTAPQEAIDRDTIETIIAMAGNSIAHMQSETALRAMSRRLMDVQEIERRHLARELHDEVGQCLTLLKMTLEGLQPVSSPSAAKYEDAMGQIDHLLSQVRNMALELRPSMLDDLGLLAALVWHTDRISKLTRIQVDCQHQGIEGRRFLPEVETSAYRILQEAITNAIRHSGSAHVTVRVWADMEMLHLQVEDSGWGFNATEILSQAASTGLRGMHERVMLLAGFLNIESSPGKGARITAALPISVSRFPKTSFHEKSQNTGR